MREFNLRTGNSADNNWSIGLGHIDWCSRTLTPVGEEPLVTRDMVSDIDAGFVADPFYIRDTDNEFIFFEVWNNTADRGEIAVAKLQNSCAEYHKVVLREQFHLSYPCVVFSDGDFFMMPEAWECGELRLYRALTFPYEWELFTVLDSRAYADPQLFEHEGHWYLFLTDDPLINSRMSLRHSEAVGGPWQLHGCSPIVENDRTYGRSAGPPVTTDLGAMRFSQDCSSRYGEGICISQINSLSPDNYDEAHQGPLQIIKSTWNETAVHHVQLLDQSSVARVLYDGYT